MKKQDTEFTGSEELFNILYGDKTYEEIAEDFLIQLIYDWKEPERTRKITDKEVNYALRAIKEEVSRYDEKDFSMTEIGKIVVRGDRFRFFSVIPENAEERIKYILDDVNDYIRESTYGDFKYDWSHITNNL